jgi:uncharacterized membrane protein
MVSARTPISQAVATGQARPGTAATTVNVGEVERLLSLAGGGLLALVGLSRANSLAGLGMAALGGSLLYRGLSGHCPVYRALGKSTATPHSRIASVAADHGIKVTRAVTVSRSAGELYRMWRDLEALPHFMRHLVSVKCGGNRSHWVARAPAGLTASWDAEIVTDQPDRVLAWRSLAGSDVGTAGSVHFNPTPGGGTEVQVTLKYDPPGGKLGSWLVWLFGEEPGQQIAEDLARFKQLAESGALATRQGPTSWRA